MRSWLHNVAFRLFDAGYLRVGKWSGTPVRVHWTAAIGAVVFGRFQWAPAYWFAFLFLIAVHEMGHAVVVRRCGATPVSLDIHGLGGLCRWRGTVTPLDVALIAWGGVAAQFVLYLIALVAIIVFGAPTTPATIQLRSAFIEQNLFLIALNLVPIAPLDGSKTWQLPILLIARRNARKRKNARRDTIEKLRALDDADANIHSVQSDVDELLRKALANSRDENDTHRK